MTQLRLRTTGGGAGTEALPAHVAHLPQAHADFFVCGVAGFGQPDGMRAVAAALGATQPDVVMVQLCATRMGLLGKRWRASRRAWAAHLALRWLWERVCERAARQGGCFHDPAGIGGEFTKAVVLAADRDVRVVFGDRDIGRTARRGWALLPLWQRVAVLLELLTCSVIPACLTARWFGVRTEAQVREAGSDAFAEILDNFARRYPALAQQQQEHEQYLLSSMYRLDKPAGQLCPHALPSPPASSSMGTPSTTGDGDGGGGGSSTGSAPPRRGRVLVVLGHSFARGVGERWGLEVDRHDLTHNAPPLWVRAAAPLVIVVLLVVLPLTYLSAHAAAVHQSLAANVQTLAAGRSHNKPVILA